MRIEKAEYVTIVNGEEIARNTIYINPMNIVWITESIERPGYSTVRLAQGCYVLPYDVKTTVSKFTAAMNETNRTSRFVP